MNNDEKQKNFFPKNATGKFIFVLNSVMKLWIPCGETVDKLGDGSKSDNNGQYLDKKSESFLESALWKNHTLCVLLLHNVQHLCYFRDQYLQAFCLSKNIGTGVQLLATNLIEMNQNISKFAAVKTITN